jgi:hypothetical protein
MIPYAIGVLAVGGTLGVVGLTMYLLVKKSDTKPPVYPFYKDKNPTREYVLPTLDSRDEQTDLDEPVPEHVTRR